MAEWSWRYSSRSKVIVHDTPSHAIDYLCLIWKEFIQKCRRYRGGVGVLWWSYSLITWHCIISVGVPTWSRFLYRRGGWRGRRLVCPAALDGGYLLWLLLLCRRTAQRQGQCRGHDLPGKGYGLAVSVAMDVSGENVLREYLTAEIHFMVLNFRVTGPGFVTRWRGTTWVNPFSVSMLCRGRWLPRTELSLATWTAASSRSGGRVPPGRMSGPRVRASRYTR